MTRRQTTRKRLRILSGLVAFVALVLGVKLYFVQIVNGQEYSQQANGQYVQPSEYIFDRGDIYVTRKDGSTMRAAFQNTGFVLSINPQLIEDPAGTFEALSTVIELDEDEFIEAANDPEDTYIEIQHRLDHDVTDAVDALGKRGVYTYRELWREYPGGELASNVLGFVGYEGYTRTGSYGVERFHNEILERNSSGLYVNFFAQIFAGIKDVVNDGLKNQEGDVVLTIDPVAQQALEEELEATKNTWNAKQTMGIVMDPQTGEIVAMAVRPTFDPNTYSQVEDPAVYNNPLVEGRYEMGSIIKPLTVASGLDAGVITPNSTYEDRGTVRLNGSVISNYDGEARGVVDMQEVLNQSLNTGVAHIAKQLGHENMREYFYGYGFDEKTGIDLPFEVSSDVGNLTVNRDLEFATASFGQGIALTPIATARALSVMANGGKLVQPHVTKRIDYKVGWSDSPELETEQVLKPETSEEISRMLTEVYGEALLGGKVKKDRYSIASKTGTAQVARESTGGYYEDRFNHTFFGYFPAFDPEFLILLVTIEPQGARFASQTLTDPFVNLTDFLINHYQIPPDR